MRKMFKTNPRLTTVVYDYKHLVSSSVSKACGMAYVGPVARTFAQVVIASLLAAGAGFTVAAWEAAIVAGAAAALAHVQLLLRGSPPPPASGTEPIAPGSPL